MDLPKTHNTSSNLVLNLKWVVKKAWKFKTMFIISSARPHRSDSTNCVWKTWLF